VAIESLRDIVRSSVSAFASGGANPFHVGSSAPADPEATPLWFDLDTGAFLVWVDDGVTATWIEVGSSGGGGAGYIASTTEPDPDAYPLWFNLTDGVFLLWVDDGTTAQWVEPSGSDPAVNIHAATSKSTPVDADELALVDSADSWSLKKLTWANLKAVLLAYFKGQFREKLTADRTYYVRTDGNDVNDGLANTSGGAFLTIQKAIDTAASLDLGIYNVSITIGSGTFDGATLKSFVGAGRINIAGQGVGSTTVRAIASGGTGYCFGNTTTAGHDGVYSISQLKMESVVSGRQLLDFIYGFNAQVVFGNVEFGASPSASHIRAGRGAIVTNASQPYSITGGGVSHAVSVEGGQIRFQSATITLTGTPAFSGPFADAQRGGSIAAFGNTFSGSATGARYNAVNAGGIYVAGAGTTYLPGNSAGTATSPGWYA
jgi:hypothetical protein